MATEEEDSMYPTDAGPVPTPDRYRCHKKGCPSQNMIRADCRVLRVKGGSSVAYCLPHAREKRDETERIMRATGQTGKQTAHSGPRNGTGLLSVSKRQRIDMCRESSAGGRNGSPDAHKAADATNSGGSQRWTTTWYVSFTYRPPHSGIYMQETTHWPCRQPSNPLAQHTLIQRLK
jgi:hypothetical protein